jgi:hypothetical protein
MLAFEQSVSDEFTNIHSEITNLRGTITQMEEWQYTLQTNWFSRYGTWCLVLECPNPINAQAAERP